MAAQFQTSHPHKKKFKEKVGMNGPPFSYFTDQVTGFDSERSELPKLAQSSVKWRDGFVLLL